jgi:hypothetical protein
MLTDMAPKRPDLTLEIRYKGCFNQCPLPKVGQDDPEDDVRIGGSRDARPRAYGAHVKEKEEG